MIVAQPRIRRALISVHDKTDLVDFARQLVVDFGIEIISTGGTAVVLKENDIPVTLVEEVTGFPELMNGRVKTLHPKIHAAILADRDNPDHMRQLQEQDISPIDMVVVNLYPFENTVMSPGCTFEQAIEMIDIGGPCLLRAAAKNQKHVLPIGLHQFYGECLKYLRGQTTTEESIFRMRMASCAFDLTSEYDIDIHCYLEEKALDAQETEAAELVEDDGFEDGAGMVQVWEASKSLRYGENPHQKATFLGEDEACDGHVAPLALVAGGPVSFNNFADADAALCLCKELTRELLPTRGLEAATQPVGGAVCVFGKHTNPCGVGVASDPLEAYQNAYLGDPNAAMGGVLACNLSITADFAEGVMETFDRWGKEAGAGGFFLEVWVAPSFDDDALEAIKTKKKWGERVRLLAVGDVCQAPDPDAIDYKTVGGGTLMQKPDIVGLNENQWKVVTRRAPSDSEMADLRLAWLVCKHTKSNAISVCKNHMLIGNGAGQMSRKMSCRIATWLAKENQHEAELNQASAASDAFFPFSDGPGILLDCGITAIIQPGGSKRDADTIKICDDHGAAMVFTDTRHFRH